MAVKIVLLIAVLCAVIVKTECDRNCDNCRRTELTRVKRAKYYSNPPQKFYRRPPMSYPTKGAFSYTPPPGYMMDADDHPANYRPTKVSKRPTNDGLGDEDINNIIKYLSKKDLDKIIEFAGEKDRYNDDKYENRPSNRRPEMYKANVQDIDDHKFSLNGPYVSDDQDKYKNEYNNFKDTQTKVIYTNRPEENFQSPNINYVKDASSKVIYTNRPESNDYSEINNPNISYNREGSQPKNTYQYSSDVNPNENYKNNPLQDQFFHSPPQTSLDTEESKHNYQVYQLGATNTNVDDLNEETLPKPLNLREDFEVAYSNNEPTVVKAESYKVENFGDLPLMNYYNSKLHSVSSYNVPHYTVTSPRPPSAAAKPAPLIELAPAGSGQDQSDAHLKAIKIWTHRSKGTAYTLHDDGTLSLERPGRPKPVYGRP